RVPRRPTSSVNSLRLSNRRHVHSLVGDAFLDECVHWMGGRGAEGIPLRNGTSTAPVMRRVVCESRGCELFSFCPFPTAWMPSPSATITLRPGHPSRRTPPPALRERCTGQSPRQRR